MKYNSVRVIVFILLILCGIGRSFAQSGTSYTLQELIKAAIENNAMVNIRDYQIKEKQSKLKEDQIKRYPAINMEAGYQYNFNLPDLTIPRGTIGSIQTGDGNNQFLPQEDTKFRIGDKNNYNLGINFYQPLSQQFQMNTGLKIAKNEITSAKYERTKTILDMQLAVQQLYYSILIAQKQSEAVKVNIGLAKARLMDAENNRAAGKNTSGDIYGLQASLANEEHAQLKLNIQVDDDLTELSRITRISTSELQLSPDSEALSSIAPLDDYRTAAQGKPDLQIALLTRDKASLALKLSKQGNIPEIGVIGGYSLQQGNPLLPNNSPYLGLSFRWNLQNLFSNKQAQNQRYFQLKQSEENITLVQQQNDSEIDRAWRKAKQTYLLIAVADKLVSYRKAGFRELQDRKDAGLEISSGLLEKQSLLAEAEAEYYAAKLSYTMAVAKLNNLVGQQTPLAVGNLSSPRNY